MKRTTRSCQLRKSTAHCALCDRKTIELKITPKLESPVCETCFAALEDDKEKENVNRRRSLRNSRRCGLCESAVTTLWRWNAEMKYHICDSCSNTLQNSTQDDMAIDKSGDNKKLLLTISDDDDDDDFEEVGCIPAPARRRDRRKRFKSSLNRNSGDNNNTVVASQKKRQRNSDEILSISNSRKKKKSNDLKSPLMSDDHDDEHENDPGEPLDIDTSKSTSKRHNRGGVSNIRAAYFARSEPIIPVQKDQGVRDKEDNHNSNKDNDDDETFTVVNNNSEDVSDDRAWPGPDATLRRLLARREAERILREERMDAQEQSANQSTSNSNIVEWNPKILLADQIDASSRSNSNHDVKYIDCIETLGWISPSAQASLISSLCSKKLLSSSLLPLFTRPGLSELTIPDCHLITNEAMDIAFSRIGNETEELLNYGGDNIATSTTYPLEVIDLGFSGACVTDQTLESLSSVSGGLPLLRNLSLGGCFQISNNGLKSILEAAPRLCVLSISDNENISKDILPQLLNKSSQLTHLSIKRCSLIDGKAVKALGGNSNSSSIGDDGPSWCKLSTLKLSDISGLNTSHLSPLIKSCRNLAELELHNMNNLDDKIGELLMKHCNHLNKISLIECPAITDQFLKFLVKSSISLESLVLKKCSNITDEGIVVLAEKSSVLSKLKHLGINSVNKVTDITLLQMMGTCPKSLEYVDVSFCRKISDNGLGLLIDTCDNIKQLIVWGNSQLTSKLTMGHSKQRTLKIVGIMH